MRPAPVLGILLGVLSLSSCAARPAPDAAAPPAGWTNSSSTALHALFASEWEYGLRDWPTRASALGDRRFDDLWPDVSPAAFERRDAHTRELLTRLRAIDPRALSPEDQLSLRLMTRSAELDAEGQPYRLWHLLLDQLEGIQIADEIGDALPFATAREYDAWIARLRAIPAYVEQTTATLREGARERIVQPRLVMERVPAQIDRQIVSDPEKSPFFGPLQRLPSSLSDADRQRIVRDAKAAIADAVVPAYRRFKEFFTREYLPACFTEVGAWQLPHGDEAYAYLVRLNTTTRMTPREVHDVGLREVARIRSEMLALMTRLEFKGTLSDFFGWLRTDPRFFYSDPRALFDAYAATAKRIDPKLVTLFKTLPRTPYGVEAVPEGAAPDAPTAYYRGPAADGSRAGRIFVNLYKPEARPKWEITALVLHESVPGHHLQIALANEQLGLPDFRRHDLWTAYTEGWGLYAESLGDEMGVYDDPYAKFGQLTYEMWRAVRLVVDTGMHALHWDRRRAIDYFLAATPKTELDITNEVDRYIVWPGQATAYKIGQLEIRRLRAQAQASLGARFDVREFHDVVLRDGAMPLDVLEERVTSWIAERARRP
jgi:prolyl oligopeptidase